MLNHLVRLLLILLFISTFPSFCQKASPKEISQYVRQTWQTEDGLPNNSISAITQTHDGYIWFGSSSGLIRFDGVSFVSFNSGNTPGIKGDDIWSLKTDSKGRMWAGTNGSGLICYEKGKFKTITVNEGLPDNSVWSILEDKKERLLFGTGGGGIAIFNGKKYDVVDTSDGLSNNYIWTIVEDGDGNIWAGTDGGYLNRISGNNIKIFDRKNGYNGNYTMAAFAGRNNTLWFGAAGVGVLSYSEEKFKTYSVRDGLANDVIWVVYEDRKENLWVGTEDGISKITKGKISSFKEIDGLQSNAVTDIYEDFEGNIWTAVKGGGITVFKDGNLTAFTKQNGLANNNVYSVLCDSKSNTWFCTGKGLTLMRKDGLIKNFTIKDGLTSDIILAICEGKDGTIWVSSEGGGIYKYEKGKFNQIDLSEYVSSNTVLSLFEDSKGNLWMGSDGYGILSYFDGEIDWWTMGNGLSGEFISCLFEDSYGRIWAGSSDGTGLNEIIGDTAKVYTAEDGLLSNDIWSISEDKEKSLWLTTPDGLNKIQNDKIYSYTEKEGLPKVQFYSVADDDYGYLWLGSNSGIYRVSKEDITKMDSGLITKLNVQSFGISDGMRSSQCNRGSPSVSKTKDGLLWFPTIRGAVLVDPGKLNLNNRKPNVVIENIKVNGKFYSGLAVNIFQPGHGDIEFNYTALSYAAVERVEFMYMLEGWDKTWIKSGTRRNAFYTNLPPGKYRFRVLACNDAGAWNLKGAKYDFELLPYFYETSWFYIIAAVFLAGCLYSIVRIRINRLSKNKLLLEKKVQERTYELENTNIILNNEINERRIIEEALQTSLSEKEVMLKEIHHRVKNNLQVISSLLYLHSRKIKDKEVLSIFQESQNRVKSIALVHERLYQCKNLGEIDFHDYVKRLTDELFRAFAGRQSTVKINLDIKDIFINIDTAVPSALIINEIVSNSFKYAFPAESVVEEKEIEIKITRKSECQIVIELHDNGIGLPNDVAERKKNSLGMMLVESLVNQLDGTIEYLPAPGAAFRITIKG